MVGPNPFVAISGQPPKTFRGRDSEEKTFAAKLRQGIRGQCEHIAVLGDWGIGKTCLLRQLKLLAQKQGARAALVPIPKSRFRDEPANGIRLIVEELGRAFPAKREMLGKVKGAEFSIFGTGAGITLAEEQGRSPQVFLTEYLLALWKQLKSSRPVVVLIDDAQNFDSIPEAVDTLRLVLQREEIQESTRFLFVLASTPSAWSGFIHKHNPVGRFFRTRLELARLATQAMEQIIQGSLEGTGVTFAKTLFGQIQQYCQGHPYELQVLCSALYEQQIGGRVGLKAWDLALPQALRELGHSHFEAMFTAASRQERDILWVLAGLDSATLGEIRSALHRDLGSDRAASTIEKLDRNLSTLLGRLAQKGLLQRPARGQYQVEDLMFRDYVRESHPNLG